jgi:hypothetical protein
VNLDKETFEERAAIMQYDGGLSRSEAEAAASVIARANCEDCLHQTRFKNCGRPVEAKLSDTFKLIAHPKQGRGCLVFEPRVSEEAMLLLRRVDAALAAKAIDQSDADIARASIKEHSADRSYLKEWATLLKWCMQAQQRGRLHK